ncbi:hypothetical protein T492DRAFT_919731 [Pavlovales sp. CCMP2436]|nr:hypothetical protein T492DRAFT_919731 [Pavlovales sp. CCMP2436]
MFSDISDTSDTSEHPTHPIHETFRYNRVNVSPSLCKRPALNKSTEGNPTPTNNNPPQRKRTREEPTGYGSGHPRTWTSAATGSNCFLYAALGINGHGAGHPQAAATLRSRAIAHARSLPVTVQNYLEFRRLAEHPTDPTEISTPPPTSPLPPPSLVPGLTRYIYIDTTCTWSMDHQKKEKAWINSNMFYSIATVLRIDIAITHHLTTGIKKLPMGATTTTGH